LQRVLSERWTMYEEGVRIALHRPWLGWGHTIQHGTLAAVPGMDDVYLGYLSGWSANANLIRGSEALSRLPWRGWHARMVGDAAVDPIGGETADLLIGEGVPGHRVHQATRLPEPMGQEFTFSLWARTESGNGDLGLSLRDGSGRVDSVLHVRSEAGGDALGTRAVRFRLDEAWRQLSVTTSFHAPPDSLLVLIFLDGHYGGHSVEDRFLVWGAQLNAGSGALPYVATPAGDYVLSLQHIPHFHSWFVQVLVESGFVGLAALLWFLAVMIGDIRRHNHPQRAALAGVAGLVATQWFDLALAQATIGITLMLLLSAASSAHMPFQPEPSKSSEDGVGQRHVWT